MNGRERKLVSDLSQPNSMMAGRTREIGQRARKDLENQINAEPFEELTDSELNDWERDQAIARERMRREGLI